MEKSGIYKIDLPLLNRMGFTGSPASSSLRVFGGNGGMLPEANATSRPDDLVELAITVEDGGDGNFGPGDYLLFYAEGPETWQKDSINRNFRHQKNRYSRYNYYYISVQGTGERVEMLSSAISANQTVSQYDGRFFHELDTINFLASGKEWYGEEFAEAPGKTAQRSFALSLPNSISGAPASLRTACIARSVGNSSRYDIRLGTTNLGSLTVLPTGAGQYDAFAREGTAEFNFPYTDGALQFQFFPGSFNAQGWLNWFEVFNRRSLNMQEQVQIDFRDWSTVGTGPVRFEISNPSASMRVWDITEVHRPIQMSLSTTGSIASFINETNRLREYIAFNPVAVPTPELVERINNQDLHATSAVDYLIVTHPTLLNAANYLADIHRQQQSLRVRVVTTQQIFHEFSAGKADPVAIRDFVKNVF
ncbi:MAG: C25 family cysteine peptidase [Chitinophagaceae bacterium]|nr:C25 family cysteine peptidase [Chitinophagaceae bacterium]